MSAATLAAPSRITPRLSLVDGKFSPTNEVIEGRYVVRLARTSEEVEAALKLRFEVFNLELVEGLASSFRTGRECDEFDSDSQHSIIIDRLQRRIIGAYRLRTYEIAKTIQGFHSSKEFDLSALPHEILANAIEVGRVCVVKAHRNSEAHVLLLKSLGLCLMQNHKRYVFGTLSLATQDPMAAGRIFDRLNSEGYLHPEYRLRPNPGFKCLWYRLPEAPQSDGAISSWLKICLQFGAKLCGPPAINRQFSTIDFPIFMDGILLEEMTGQISFGTPQSLQHEWTRPDN